MSESSKTRLQKKFDDLRRLPDLIGNSLSKVYHKDIDNLQREMEDMELISLYSALKGDFPCIQEDDSQWSMFSSEQPDEEGDPAFWCDSWENGLPKLTDEMRKQIKNDIGMD